jgi:hypothetical protein
MTPPNGTGESTSPTDDVVLTALPALQWARFLLLAKQHGLVFALCVMMAYQIGMIATATTYVCGV